MTGEELATCVRNGLLWNGESKRFGPPPVEVAECIQTGGVYAVMPFRDSDSKGGASGIPSILIYGSATDSDEIESFGLDREAVLAVVRQALGLWSDLLEAL